MDLDFIYYGLVLSWLISLVARRGRSVYGMGPDPVSMTILGLLVLAAAAVPRMLRSWHGRRVLGALLLAGSGALAVELCHDPREWGWGVAVSSIFLFYGTSLVMSRPHGACSRCGTSVWLPLKVDGEPACGDACYAEALLLAGRDAVHGRLERRMAWRNGVVKVGLALIAAGVVGLPFQEPTWLLLGIPAGLALLAASIVLRWAVLLAAVRDGRQPTAG